MPPRRPSQFDWGGGWKVPGMEYAGLASLLADQPPGARLFCVVLGPETWPVWLGEEPADASQLKAMLAPYPAEEMTCWPVSPRVGNVKNNDPSLIEPIASAG